VVFNPALTKYVLPEAGYVSAIGLVLVAIGKSGTDLFAAQVPESLFDNLGLAGMAIIGACFGSIINLCLDRRANRFDNPQDFVLKGIGSFLVGVVLTPLALDLSGGYLEYRIDVVAYVSALIAMFAKPIYTGLGASCREFLPDLLSAMWGGITSMATKRQAKKSKEKGGGSDVEQ